VINGVIDPPTVSSRSGVSYVKKTLLLSFIIPPNLSKAHKDLVYATLVS